MPLLLPGMRGSASSVDPSVGWLSTPGTAGVPEVREGEPTPAHGPSHSSLRQQDHELSPQRLALSSGDLVSQQALVLCNHMLEDCRGWLFG